MRIVDEALLETFRQPGPCSWCGRWFPRLDAAHVFAKGLGSGSRLDVTQNLVSLCRQDHSMSHAGKSPTRAELLAIVAEREGVSLEDIEVEIFRLRREPKGGRATVLRSEEAIRDVVELLAWSQGCGESATINAALERAAGKAVKP